VLIVGRPDFTIPDSLSYCAYLRSAVFDRDLDFANEFERFGMSPVWSGRSETGHAENMVALGSAVLWLPFYLMGHALTLLVNWLGVELPTDGWSPLYRAMIQVGSSTYGGVCLLLCYATCRRRFSHESGRQAAMLVWLGTPFLYYVFYLGAYAHVNGAFCVALFVWFWDRTRLRRTSGQWFLLGLAWGLASLVRWQNCLAVGIVIVEAVHLCRVKRGRQPLGWGLFLLGGALAFSPQVVAWRVIFGEFLPSLRLGAPLGGPFRWSRPSVLEFLLFPRHGFLFWTPVAALGLIGVVWLWRYDRVAAAGSACVLGAQIYVNSAADWWAGWSFGARRMVDMAPFLALGFAAFWERASAARDPRRRRWLRVAVGVGLVWTALLALQLYTGITDGEKDLLLSDVLAGQWRVLMGIPRILWRIVVTDQLAPPQLLPVFLPAAAGIMWAVLSPAARLLGLSTSRRGTEHE